MSLACKSGGGGGPNALSTTGLRKQARACVRRLLFAYTES